jgi:membrane-associated phospholipid phosphatase
LIAFALAAAVGFLAMRAASGARERALVEGAFGGGGDAGIALARLLALLGNELVVFPMVAVVIAVLLLRRLRWAAIWLGVSAVGGYVTVQTSKALIGRERPVWEAPLADATTASMPSGHAATGIDVWIVFGLLAVLLLPRRLGVPLLAACVAIGLAMGPSRLVLGLHWPGDVLAGWLVGLGWLLLGLAAARVAAQRVTRPGRISRSGLTRPESS